MHEGNFTQQIVDAILAELGKRSNGRARRVHVKVGEMLHLNQESVQAHFISMTKGTPLETAALELEDVPTQVRCKICGRVWTPEDHHYLFCDSCQKSEVEVISGNGVVINSIDLDL